jgi:hypothetical protein
MFIEIPIQLIDNSPEDELDLKQIEQLELLGVDVPESDYPEITMDVLFNIDWILRINPSGENECTIWLENGMSFKTLLSYDEIKNKISLIKSII